MRPNHLQLVKRIEWPNTWEWLKAYDTLECLQKGIERRRKGVIAQIEREKGCNSD